MDYEKKYNEALERARKELKQDLHESGIWAIQRIFPQLRESEDERIRKFLIKLVNDGFTHFPDSLTRNGVLTYLEKQKESTWTEEDESFRKHILPRILDPKGWTMEQRDADRKRLEEFVERQKNKWIEKQKEQKPTEPAGKLSREEYLYQLLIDQLITYSDYEYLTGKKPAEWSEEDEKMRNLIVAIFEVNHPDGFFKANEIDTTDMRGVHTEEIISWLKSLRPQPHWKPSEEQIEELYNTFYTHSVGAKSRDTLETLYNELKKLM